MENKFQKVSSVEHKTKIASCHPPDGDGSNSAGIMKLKPKKPEEEDIKVKREKAKLKKKDIVKQRGNAADREIFVGNVASTVRRREIEQLFKKFGTIEKVWSRSVVGLSEKKTQTLVRKYKKMGSNVLDVINFYIRYKSPESVAKALEMNGLLFKGLHLRVTGVNKKSLCVGSSAFVSNLPFDITEEEIHQHFNECGDIKAIRVVHDRFSGLGKGAAFVEFSEKECVEKAIAMNGTTLKERELRVAKALKRKQLAKEAAIKSKNSKGKKKEAEKMQEKIADYVVQKKPVGKNVKIGKSAGKLGAKEKKFKKTKKGPVKSIMT
uniref:RRM domain-containing protein n=1 Tax=Panagrolaimus superbus TaxID=310955 RepID=A0A914YGT3_9BILA